MRVMEIQNQVRERASERLRITLTEWETCIPTPGQPSRGYFLDPDPAVRRTAESLNQSRRLEILELAAGLQVRARQYVGMVRLGSLEIVVQPKLESLPLFNLLRYAYHLHRLDLFDPLDLGTQPTRFQDLLIWQLCIEARELLERGLHRRYERLAETLSRPRGRVDFQVLAQRSSQEVAALPCIYFQRMEDNLLNQVLLAGLQFAVRLTDDLALRAELRRQAGLLAATVAARTLNGETLAQAQRLTSRLTAAYRPVLVLIELLMAAQGLSWQREETTVRLSGFLFDMNRFFQALLGRFLSEHLPGYEVQSEHQLHGMFAYHPQHNPRHRQSPTPRPDFAIRENGRTLTLLDAKYRDLWETTLPREMLYQLALYAFSQGDDDQAVILYPTLSPEAREAWVEIQHPLTTGRLGRVILRPVDMLYLDKLITAPQTVVMQREQDDFAWHLAFGRSAGSSTRAN